MSDVVLLGKREILDHVRSHPDEIEPGLSILKAELEVAGGVPVDLLAVDATGRPCLVFAGPEGSDGLLLALLDGMAWAAGARAFLERLRDRRLDCAAPPRAFLVVPNFPDRLRQRVAALGGFDLTVVRVELWREGGTRRLACVREARPGAPLPGAALEPGLRALWDEGVASLRKLDPDLEVTLLDRHAEARHAGSLVAVLGARPDRLRGLVSDEAEEDVRDRRTLHRFLDAALGRLLQVTVDAADPASGAPSTDTVLTQEELGELTR
ncbi:MAG TPA: hypothetical protein VFI25_10965 [Planctomycetota bacterium]|jgi:hypothetical protein|nr:hypothetical protein [Planctomycetota bacterium]